MQRDKKKIESSLKSKGFSPKNGDHNYFLYITKEGKISDIRTKTSHGKQPKTIGEPLLSLMAKQCHLEKSDFLNLIDCPLSQEDYEAKLKEHNDI